MEGLCESGLTDILWEAYTDDRAIDDCWFGKEPCVEEDRAEEKKSADDEAEFSFDVFNNSNRYLG